MTPLQAAYDSNVLPHLRRIRHCAKMVTYYAKEAERSAEQMAFLPEWATQAEADIADAAKTINGVLSHFSAKPRKEV